VKFSHPPTVTVKLVMVQSQECVCGILCESPVIRKRFPFLWLHIVFHVTETSHCYSRSSWHDVMMYIPSLCGKILDLAVNTVSRVLKNCASITSTQRFRGLK